MFEIKITAETLTELRGKLAELATLGGSTPDVPLPAPRKVRAKAATEPVFDPVDHVTKETTSPVPDSQEAEFEPSETEPVLTQDVAAEVMQGAPGPGEIYLLLGHEPNADGRYLTYRDGERFSTAGPKTASKLFCYAQHSPVIEAEPENPTETASAQAAEVTPAMSERAEIASPDGPAASGGAPQQSGPTEKDAPAIRATPEDRQEPTFLEGLQSMTSWPEAMKPAIVAMMKTSDWLSASPSDQDELRRAIWPNIERLGIDPAWDVSAFGIFIATLPKTQDGLDAATGTLNALKREPVWPKLKTEQQASLQGRVDALAKAVRG